MPDRIADPWGSRTPYGPGDPWPERIDAHLAPGVDEDQVQRWTRAASLLHSNGDAMDVASIGDRIVGVRGRAGDRVNRGGLGPKGPLRLAGQRVARRLTRPLIRRDGRLVETDWDTAMDVVVSRSKELLADPGGWGRIGFYTSGQLFLEEYYTLAVIGKAGIGTPHMDGNTRLCTATAGAALKASFGSDGQPGSYADVDHCDAIALADYPPERVERICDVPARDVREAARIIGTSERLLSTVLQGVYQSHQATATACQVNNLHLLRGMLGRPDAGCSR